MVQGTPRAEPRRRSTRRKLLFVGMLALVGVVAIEVTAWLLYLMAFGGFSYRSLHDEQRQRSGMPMASEVAAVEARPADEFGVQNRLHPYLGFVLDSRLNSPTQNVATGATMTRFGFWTLDGRGPVRQRADDRVVVGVTGGSVASMFSRHGALALEEEFRRHPAFADKRIDVVPMAIGGYKQPQQLMVLNYLLSLGGEFDVLICLDGFNEVVLPITEKREGAWPPAGPRLWELLADRTPDPQVRRWMGRADYFESLRRDVAGWMAAPWRWSIAANFLWRAADRWFDRQIGESEHAVERAVVALSRRHLASEEEMVALDTVDDLVALWSRCSRRMQEICELEGISYHHFLQPNQYVPGAKPLSDEERRVAYVEDSPYRMAVLDGYPALRAEGEALARDGVRFEDLTLLFADREETLYSDDCCHLNKTGNDLLARAIARSVLEHFDPAGHPPLPEIQALRTDLESYTLRRPFVSNPLRIYGTTANGGERDVTYAGVEFASSDPEVVSIDRWGEFTALRSGRAVLTATLGALSIDIQVEVSYPEFMRLDGAHSVRRGERLEFAFERRQDKLLFTVNGARQKLDGFLVLSEEPRRQPMCGGMAYVPVGTAKSVGWTIEPERSSLEVPWVPGSENYTFFAQVFVAEKGHRCGFSLSNAILFTLR